MTLPLTQIDLADALGLTPVDVNRVLQEFRRNGLLSLEQRTLTLHDLQRLQQIAEIRLDYLHLGGAPEIASGYFDRQERVLRERQRG